MKEKEILQQVMSKWGKQEQLFMLIEESAELISAINRYVRRRDNSFLELLEEMADVEILLEQVKMLLCIGLDKYQFTKIKRAKLRRLGKRLQKV